MLRVCTITYYIQLLHCTSERTYKGEKYNQKSENQFDDVHVCTLAFFGEHVRTCVKL